MKAAFSHLALILPIGVLKIIRGSRWGTWKRHK